VSLKITGTVPAANRARELPQATNNDGLPHG